jgi:hypothetical protein
MAGMDALATVLERSPEIFPHSLDLRSDSVAFVRLNEADFARASFLDARVLGRLTRTLSHPWPQVEAAVAAAGLAENCDFIFHIGHVGSTLLSRLLGRSKRILALREPLILRTLAQMAFEREAGNPAWPADEWERRTAVFLKLWSRTFRDGQRVCVKATSFASEIAAQLIRRPSAPKALLMALRPESYLATILGGPNSRQEMRILAPSRLARLRQRTGSDEWQLECVSEGEMIAMGWMCEAMALFAAGQAAPEQVRYLDFDQFLANPAAGLSEAMFHLRGTVDESEVPAMLSAQDLRRYSKAPEHNYDARLRRDVLDQARREHGDEIRRGLVWLDQAASQHSAIRDALNGGLLT